MSVPTKTGSPALFRMNQAAKLVSFEGFFLKPGYYYGYDESGRPNSICRTVLFSFL